MTRAQALIENLRTRRGRLLDPARDALTASIAVPLRPCGTGEGLELLYLLRAQRGGDPWSGHISFPGGKIDPSDAGPRETAIRETREETCLDLTRAEYICRLDDQATHLSKVHVAAFVYYLEHGSILSLNHEIQRAYWIPLADLMDEKRYVTAVVSGTGVSGRSPPSNCWAPRARALGTHVPLHRPGPRMHRAFTAGRVRGAVALKRPRRHYTRSGVAAARVRVADTHVRAAATIAITFQMHRGRSP